jgi:hypothetical protein
MRLFQSLILFISIPYHYYWERETAVMEDMCSRAVPSRPLPVVVYKKIIYVYKLVAEVVRTDGENTRNKTWNYDTY